MRQGSMKALYELHSWTGLLLGLVLYVVSFSGIVALFEIELGPWERGTCQPAYTDHAKAVDTLYAEAEARWDEIPANFSIYLPGYYDPLISLQAREGELVLDAATGEEAGQVRDGRSRTGEVLNRLHTDLLLPLPWGRYLVGFFGFVMLLSLVSGVFLHRKMLAELFTLRLRRSVRLKWTDMHKSAGLWGLPFHFMMALTGCVLGFIGVFLLAAAFLSFRGDAGAASEAMSGAISASPGEAAQMVPPGLIVANALRAMPDLEPEQIVFDGWGRKGGLVTVYGTVPGRLIYFPAVVMQGETGQLEGIVDWSREGIGKRIYAMVTPLHYGNFGGIALKLLYAVLGLGSCLLVLSGISVWRARPAAMASRGNRVFLAFSDGIVHGLPLATAALLLAGRLMPHAIVTSYGWMVVFLLGVLCVAVLLALASASQAHRLSGITAILLLAFPLTTFLVAGPGAFAALPILSVDILAVLLAMPLLRRALRPV